MIAWAIAGARCHPKKDGPELRGSMQAGARRCLRKLTPSHRLDSAHVPLSGADRGGLPGVRPDDRCDAPLA